MNYFFFSKIWRKHEVMIKKRSATSSNIRKRDISSIENIPTEEEPIDVEENVQEVKELISLRKEIKGVIKSKGLFVQSQKSELPSEQNEDNNSVTKSGIFAMKQDKKKSFAEQKMEEHIEQEMRKRGLVINLSTDAKLEVKKEEEDSLFPENASKAIKEPAQEPKSHKELIMITEVSLPVQYKLKNIEETEKAAQEFSRQQSSTASKHESSSNNFHFQQTKQHKPNQHSQATDDKVFEQFKKRYRK